MEGFIISIMLYPTEFAITIAARTSCPLAPVRSAAAIDAGGDDGPDAGELSRPRKTSLTRVWSTAAGFGVAFRLLPRSHSPERFFPSFHRLDEA